MVNVRLRSRMVASIPLLLVLILSCSLTEKTEKQGEEAEASEEEVVILGEFGRDWILRWNPAYTEGHHLYEPRPEVVELLRELTEGVTIKVFWGTWCSDSRKVIPSFLKLLDEVPMETTFIALDRDKKEPVELVGEETIELVPTFIVYRDGGELGRIVESPRARIEEDLLALLLD